jgi:hypothetical protein
VAVRTSRKQGIHYVACVMLVNFCRPLQSYGTTGVVRVVCGGRAEPNIEAGVLGEKFLMESIETGLR